MTMLKFSLQSCEDDKKENCKDVSELDGSQKKYLRTTDVREQPEKKAAIIIWSDDQNVDRKFNFV